MNQQEFEWHIDAITVATANKALKESVAAVLLAHGFERWLYASENPYGMLGMPTTLANEIGKWMLAYVVKGYQKIDPVVLHCRTSMEPLLWDPKVGWEMASYEVQDFMDDVAAHGFGSGVAIPLRGPNGNPRGVLSVTSAAPLCESRPHFEATLPRLVQVGQAMHGAMINIMKTSARLQLKCQQVYGEN